MKKVINILKENNIDFNVIDDKIVLKDNKLNLDECGLKGDLDLTCISNTFLPPYEPVISPRCTCHSSQK